MRIASNLRRRLVSLVSVGSLVAAGLAATVLVTPAAAAAVSPVVNPSASAVTADALPTVQIDGVAWDQAIAGSKVYVAGKFNNARPAGSAPGANQTPRANMLAYNLTTGVLDSSFNPVLNQQAQALAVSPDGTKVYVGGNFTTANGANRYRLAAYSTVTGALITTFAGGVDYVVKAIVATNTTVYIGGSFSASGNQARKGLAAFNASNGALLGWNPSADGTVNTMVMAPDGNIIAGGAFQNVNGSPAYGLARIDPVTGSLLPWNATNVIRNAGAEAAITALSTDGSAIYGTGYTFGSGGNLEGSFKANTTTGDVEWVEDCHGDTYDAYVTNHVVYTVSHAHYCGNLGGFPQTEPNWNINMKRALAFTDTATGTLGHDPLGYFDFYGTPSPSLTTWFPTLDAGTFTGKSQAAWTVTGNSQYVVMGGEFPKVNGVGQQGLVRFAVKGVAPSKIGPDFSGANFKPSVIGLPSGGVRIAWQANTDRDDHTLTYKLVRNGNAAQPIYQVNADSTFWSRPDLGFIDKTVVAGQSYQYRLYATDSAGNQVLGDNVSIVAPPVGTQNAYAATVLADGAAPYWPLDETSGPVFYDNGGFKDGDVGAGVTRSTPGAVSGTLATTFDGATSAATRTLVTAPDTFTAQAWIKTTSTSGGKILGFGNTQTGLSGNYDRHVYMDSEGRIIFGVYPGGVATVSSATGLNDGQWHQVTASLGSDGMKLYIDGRLIGQRADVTFGQAYSGYWRVGGDNLGGWPNQGSNYFTGSIDEVAFYPTVLSRQKIDAQWVASGRPSTIPAAPADAYGAAVFNDNPLLFWRLGESSGTSAADSGPNGDQLGIYQNGVQQGATGGIKGTTNTAAAFDGSDDLVASVNSFSNPQNYSEEAWFKTTTTNGGKIIGFGAAQTGTSNGYDRHVYMSNDGKVTFGTWTNFTNTITSPTALNDGQWHHVVATQSTSTGMALYIDGALVGTNAQTGAQDYTGYWRVGGDNHWGCCSPFIAATIDDVAIYQTVLNAATVANHFNLGNTVEPANQAPIASFISSAVYLDASFDASGSTDPDGSIASYSWDFGDSSPGATDKLASHSYAVAGTYTVMLTVTDNKGETNVTSRQVTATAPPANVAPTATFTASVDVLKASVDGSGSADSDGTIASYSWNFGDGTAAVTGPTPTATHTYTTAGSYTVTLTVTDNKAATGQTTKSITVTAPVNQAPVPAFTSTNLDLTATLNASGSTDADGISLYSWDFGDGNTATGINVSHTYTAAGTYQVKLTVTDTLGASASLTQPVVVSAPVVNQPPSAGFIIEKSGLAITATSSSTDNDGTIVSYLWDLGDGTTSTTGNVTHTYATGGSFQVKLTVIDDKGASNSFQESIVVQAPVTPNVAPVAAFPAPTINGLSVSVNGTSSTDSDGTVTSYLWDFGDGGTATDATATHSYLAEGTYLIKLTVTDDDGATNTSAPTSVTVSAPVTPVAYASDAFARVVANGLGTAEIGGAWTISGTSSWFAVESGVAKFKMPAAGAGPGAILNSVSALDVDASVDVKLDKVPTGSGTYAQVVTRRIGNSDYRFKLVIKATSSNVYISKFVNGAETILSNQVVNTLGYAAGDTFRMRFQTYGTGTTTLKAKAWKVGTVEPAAWQATVTDSQAVLQAPGAVGFVAYLSGSSTNAPVVASVDNFLVKTTASP